MTKSFGYPIPFDRLERFLCPDETYPPEADAHFTYFRSDWWTLRTAQATGITPTDELTIPEHTLAEFTRLETTTEKDWIDLDTIAPLVNKFPTKIWERTLHRHHLQTFPLVLINDTIIQRGILALCTRLPRAQIHTKPHGGPVAIRFKSGCILIKPMPQHSIGNRKISLTFFQPKQRIL